MLRAKSEAEQSGRQPLQQRHSAEHAQRQRWRYFLGAFEDAADDPVLHEDLYRLYRPGGKFAPALNGVKIVIGDAAAQKTRRQDVARGDGVLRLMPTPPIGDMAWAASPMHNRPGRCQIRNRSTATVSSLTSDQSPSSWTRSCK